MKEVYSKPVVKAEEFKIAEDILTASGPLIEEGGGEFD